MAAIIFFFSSLVSHFFRSIRVSLISKDSKLLASLGNCATFTFAAITTKFIAVNDWWIGIGVECIASFFGCYLAMYIYERFIKADQDSHNRDA